MPFGFDKYNETVQCDSDLKDCSIYCIGKYSCAYADIICPQNNQNATCTVYCESYGCSHATIIAHNISSLVLHTKSDYGLEYSTTEVRYLKNVIFNCDNWYGCQYMTVMAINTIDIDIQCHGSRSCRSSNIVYVSDGDYVSGYTVPASVNLDCYGYYSCLSGSVNSNAGYLNVACNSDSSSTDGCDSLSVYCPRSSVLASSNDITTYCEVLCGKTDSCISLNVYSINGWNNAHVSSINGQSINGPTMHCNPAFSQSCTMQRHVNSGDWYCDDSEICSDYRWDVNATLLIPTHSYQYYNKTIECALDEDCYIFCGKSYSCMYSTIECANSNCSLHCYGTGSCQYAAIKASNTKTLNIYVTAPDALSYSTVYSSHNHLYMECSDTSSCQHQTIYASNTDQITMSCSSSYSCRYQRLYAEYSNNIHQICDGSYSCANSALYQYSSSQSPSDITHVECRGASSCYQSSIRTSLQFHLKCGSDRSCDSLDAFIPDRQSFHALCVTDGACTNIDIYSLNGFMNSNVNITSFDDTYANTAKFYCGSGYTKFCTLNGLLDSDQWICTDANNYCYNYQFDEENTDHIVLNDDRKYAYDYVECDQNKTHCDIKCKADYGCWNAKVICPIHQNATCSIYCAGSSSCTNLDIYALNGYSELSFDCNDNSAYCSGITIFCTQYFNESCVMDSNGNCLGFCATYTNSDGVTSIDVQSNIPITRFLPNSSYIVATFSYQYYTNTVSCTGNAHNKCTIKCIASHSCEHSSIVFVGNDLDCHLECAASYSCESATIHTEHCRSINIIGTGSRALRYSIIHPSRNQTLSVHCVSSYSCRYLKLYENTTISSVYHVYQSCPGYYSCAQQYWSIDSAQSVIVDCLAAYSCYDSRYYVYSPLSSIWNCKGSDSCYGATIKTDTGDTTIHCDADDACYASKLYVPDYSTVNCSHPGACENTAIYSVLGSKSLRIVSTVNNTFAASNKLYCTESYIRSCVLQNDGTTDWNCASNDFCYEYVASDHDHIKTTYKFQFYHDDIICNNAQNCIITCEHEYGCQYSNIQCPNDHECDIYCGSNGCLYSTINIGSNGHLKIACYDSSSCSNSIIYGDTTSQSISVQCLKWYSCSYMQVFVELVNDINVYCIGSYSCQYGQIYQYAADLIDSKSYINCQGAYACRSMLFATNSVEAELICNQDTQNDYGCNSVNIYYNGQTDNGLKILCGNPNSCKNNNYYVLNGVNGANITAYAESNTLYCCELWIGSCALERQQLSDELTCSDDSICAPNGCSFMYSSNVITSIQTYEYYNKTIECDDNNMDCNIICKAQYACNYATIYCPSGYNCKLYCTNQYSCDHAVIQATDSNSLLIQASGSYSLASATIYAPNNQNRLDILCSSSSSCAGVQLNAPYSYINALQCSAINSCSNMRISADYASYFDWSCTASYSCNIATVRTTKTNISASLICSGYYSCSEMDIHLQNTDKIYINCGGSRACQSANIYAPNAITYDTLYCGASTTCAGLKTYCAYPSMDKVCTLRYESVPDVWLCEGDICIYDEDCQHYDGLELRPNSGSVLGGDTVLITGPCYNPNINYTCKFGTKQSQLHVINSTHGYCI
eukprot:462871_1